MGINNLGVNSFEEMQLNAMKAGATREEVASVTRQRVEDTPYIAEQLEGVDDEPMFTPRANDKKIPDKKLSRVDRAVAALTDSSQVAMEPASVDTAANRIARGFAETNPLSTNIADWASTKFPSLAGRLYWDDERHGTGFVSATELYGESFNNPLVRDDVRREAIQTKRKVENEEFYSGVSTDNAAYMIGQAGGAVVDPTSLIPFGGGMAAAIKGGAIIGGIDAAAMDLAQDGDVTASNVAMGVMLGAGAGAAIEGLIVAPIQRLIGGRKMGGKDVTKDDVKDMLPEELKDSVDVQTVSERINAIPFDDPAEVKLATEMIERSDLPVTEARMMEFWQAKAAEAEGIPNYWDNYKVRPKGYLSEKELAKKAATTSKAGGRLPRVERKSLTAEIKDLKYKLKEHLKETPEPNVKVVRPVKGAPLLPKEKRGRLAATKRDRADMSKVAEDLESRITGIQRRLDADSGALKAKQELSRDEAGLVEPTRLVTVEDPVRITEVPTNVDSAEIETMRASTATYEKFVFDEVTTPELAQQVVESAPDGKVTTTTSKDVKDQARATIKHGQTTRGSKVGQEIDPVNPTLDDMDMDVPSNEMGIYKRFVNGMLSPNPSKRFDNYGGAAAEFSALMKQSYEAVNQRVGTSMERMKTIFREAGISKLNSVEAKQVTAVLRRTLNAEDVSPGVARAARFMEGEFKKVLAIAHKQGIIDAKEFKRLTIKSKDHGYFPRIYDEDRLRTPEGMAEWVEALSGKAFKSEESAHHALKVLTGDDTKAYQAFKTQLKTDGTRVIISKELANSLYRNKLQRAPARSSHLEAARRIPEEMEEWLSPFLFDDPGVVMSQYFSDIHTRIEYAKRFGNNDNVLADLAGRMEAKGHKGVAEDMQEVYFAAVRDPKSKNVRSFYERPELTKKVVGSLKSFESLKLVFAQVLNAGQAPINGTTRLAGVQGLTPFEAYSISLKGLMEGYSGGANSITGGKMGSAELRQMQNEVGGNISTMLLESAGEINQSYHTVAQREFKGIFAPFNVLNNPAKFLTATGFFAIEDINRRVATSMGKGAVDTLIAKKLALAPLKKNKRQIKQFEHINKGLEEFGLDSKMDPNQYSTDELAWAYQRFSNQVNFINAPHTMPIMMQSFWGKFMGQFKSFSLHHSTFIVNHILGPAKRGNLVPLATYVGVGTPAGMAIGEFRRWLMADDKEMTQTEKMLNGLMMVGGLGIGLDLAKNAYYKEQGLISAIAGPAVGDISALAYGAAQTAVQSVEKGEFVGTPMARAAVNTMVFPLKKQVLRDLAKEKKGLDAAISKELKSSLKKEL